MKIVNSKSLVRGATLVDFAFSDGGSQLELDIPDFVGIVAAYLGEGLAPNHMERLLGARLHPWIGRRAKETYRFFNDRRGGGLWLEGGSLADIKFTHPGLDAMYPEVNEAQARDFGSD